MRLLKRFLVVLVFGLVTFFPNYGLAWLAVAVFPSQPWLTSLVAALWLVLCALFLPLTLGQFRKVSTVAIAAAMAVLTGYAWTLNILPVTTEMVVIYAIVFIFTLIGWLMIATPIWRATRGIVAVEQTPE